MSSERAINPLLEICIDSIYKNLVEYHKSDYFLLLPSHIKNRMLHKLTSTSAFCKEVDIKDVLSILVNPSLKTIDLTLTAVNDEILKTLRGCSNLRDIYLSMYDNHYISTQGIINLVSSLEHLYMFQIPNCTAMSDEVLIVLSENCPSLSILDVKGCVSITDVALEALSCMENLTRLTLSSTQISNKGINFLVKGPSGLNIKELKIENCRNLTTNVLDIIVEHCPIIEVLIFFSIQLHETCNIDDEIQSNILQRTGVVPQSKNCLRKIKQLSWTVQW